MEFSHLITLEEAAAKLGCSISTIRRRIDAGTLTAHRLWKRTLLARREVELLAQVQAGKGSEAGANQEQPEQ